MNKAPVVFISHGSPMFSVLPGKLGPRLSELGAALSGVRAVLVVSPHWQTRGVRVMATAQPETIHDFGGFPPVLYTLQYPATGAPEVAELAANTLQKAGFPVRVETQRGLDHGAWVPLRYLFPQADVPVLQVSMPFDLDAAGALKLGAALAGLREQGVLIVGSGSLTHNLYEFRRPVLDPDYVQVFADWIRAAVQRRDIAALADYRRLAPQAERAHPSEEHYLPLLVAIAASTAQENPTWLEGGITDGILVMDSYVWGLPAEAGSNGDSNGGPNSDSAPPQLENVA